MVVVVDARLLLGSGSTVVLVTVTLSVSTAPFAIEPEIVAVNVKTEGGPTGRLAIVHSNPGVVPPGFKSVQVQPAGTAGTTARAPVLLGGSACSSTTFAAAPGPLLVTVTVYVMPGPKTSVGS